MLLLLRLEMPWLQKQWGLSLFVCMCFGLQGEVLGVEIRALSHFLLQVDENTSNDTPPSKALFSLTKRKLAFSNTSSTNKARKTAELVLTGAANVWIVHVRRDSCVKYIERGTQRPTCIQVKRENNFNNNKKQKQAPFKCTYFLKGKGRHVKSLCACGAAAAVCDGGTGAWCW